MAECRGGGDFLRIVMQEIARKQGVARWADCTPDHLLYMEEIKRQIPDALFIHIIRDGRDVALSYVQQGWSYPLPWDRDERLGVAGLYWEWVVRKGREQGPRLGVDYQEVRFEELIANPRQTLSRLGEFIEHDLDYERIQCAESVPSANRILHLLPHPKRISILLPAGRRKCLGARQLHLKNWSAIFSRNWDISPGSETGRRMSLRASRLRTTYLAMFEAKHWMKATPLGRLVGLEPLEIEPKAAG